VVVVVQWRNVLFFKVGQKKKSLRRGVFFIKIERQKKKSLRRGVFFTELGNHLNLE
jgi:hypothetical protein